jgi:hypothetical protein
MTYPGLKRVEIFFSSLSPRSTPPPRLILYLYTENIKYLCYVRVRKLGTAPTCEQKRERGENVVYFTGCTDAALDNYLVSFSMTWISRDVLKRPKDDLVEEGATRGTTAPVYYWIYSSVYSIQGLYTVYKGVRVHQLVWPSTRGVGRSPQSSTKGIIISWLLLTPTWLKKKKQMNDLRMRSE